MSESPQRISLNKAGFLFRQGFGGQVVREMPWGWREDAATKRLKPSVIAPIAALLMWSQSAPAQEPATFDIGAIDWNKVESKVRWVNFYAEHTVLTLAVDGFPALKKVRPSRQYAPTKFPFGAFTGSILDHRGREPNAIEKFPLRVENKERHVVVTTGSDEAGSTTRVLKESSPRKGQGSRITVFNAMPDRAISWERAPGEFVTIESGQLEQVKLSKDATHSSLISAPGDDGKRRVLRVRVAASGEAANWIAFCHLDDIQLKDPKLSFLKEGSDVFIEPAAPKAEE